MSDSFFDILIGIFYLLGNAAIATIIMETKEVPTANFVTFAVNILVVVSIPVSISLGTFFAEEISWGIALLLHIVRAMFEVTFNSELPDVVSFSLAKWCVALITSYILGSIGNNCLYGDNCCDNGISVFHNVSFTRFVMSSSACLASPSVNSAVAIFFVMLGELVELIEGVQAIAIVSVLGLIEAVWLQNDRDLVASQDWGVVVESINDIILSQSVLVSISIICS